MIICILCHLPQVGNNVLNLDSAPLQALDQAQFIYVTFFMPVFFMITGYCSSFKKEFKAFLKANFFSLIWAGIALGVISSLLGWGISVKAIVKNFVLYGCGYWFLTALYVSKLIYYAVSNNITKEVARGGIMLILCTIGYLLHKYMPNHNYWYIQHSLLMVPFLYVGQVIKQHDLLDKRSSLICIAIYLVFLSIEAIHYPLIPSISATIIIGDYCDLIINFIMAVTGGIGIIYM